MYICLQDVIESFFNIKVIVSSFCSATLARIWFLSFHSPFVYADSTVLAYVLSELNRRHNYGLDLFLLSVDEGITGYRDDSLETVKRNEIQVWCFSMLFLAVNFLRCL